MVSKTVQGLDFLPAPGSVVRSIGHQLFFRVIVIVIDSLGADISDALVFLFRNLPNSFEQLAQDNSTIVPVHFYLKRGDCWKTYEYCVILKNSMVPYHRNQNQDSFTSILTSRT